MHFLQIKLMIFQYLKGQSFNTPALTPQLINNFSLDMSIWYIAYDTQKCR